MFFSSRKIICPFCISETKISKKTDKCLQCKAELPEQYVHDYQDNPPFFVQVFGWSQHGKTVFLSALTRMLMKMTDFWPHYSWSAANDVSQRKVREVTKMLAASKMPDLTQLGKQEIYVMILRHMERWGGSTLVMRDCPGEIFDTMRVPVEQAPFLLKAPVTFMLVSLPDLERSADGRSMDMLMNNYINTLLKHGVKFNKQNRALIVVLTKCDLVPDLPETLREYLVNDQLYGAAPPRLDEQGMSAYMKSLQHNHVEVREWLQRSASGKNFVRLAENRNIHVRYTLISALGSDVGHAAETIIPRRVMDPYFWALELKSKLQ